MEVEHSTDIPEGWNALVDQSPQSWLFHRSEWLDLARRVWTLNAHFFFIRRDSALLAALPVQYSRNRPPGERVATSPGPLLANGIDLPETTRLLKQLSDTLVDWAGTEMVTSVECTLPPLAKSQLANNRGINPLALAGWSDVSTYTSVIDLSESEEKLHSAVSPNARRTIRKSVSAGYSVVRLDWNDCVDEYYAVHVETYRRTGAGPHPRAYFQAIAEEIAGRGHAELFACIAPDGERVAFLNFAMFGCGGYYWTGCSRTAHIKSGVNYLLLWNAIIHARAVGCRAFDVGETLSSSSSQKLRGLAMFKTRFGGCLHRYLKAQISIPTSVGVRALDFGWRCTRKVSRLFKTSSAYH